MPRTVSRILICESAAASAGAWRTEISSCPPPYSFIASSGVIPWAVSASTVSSSTAWYSSNPIEL